MLWWMSQGLPVVMNLSDYILLKQIQFGLLKTIILGVFMLLFVDVIYM